MKREEINYENESSGFIGVLAGSTSDLSTVDVSPWGLKFYQINDRSFRDYVKLNSLEEDFDRNWESLFVNSRKRFETDEEFWDADKLNLIVPISLDKLPNEEDIKDCRRALMILYPSEFKLLIVHHLQVFDSKIFYSGAYTYNGFIPMYTNGDTYEYYLDTSDSNIEEVNEFLKIYKRNVDKLKYVNTAIRFYLSSWEINDFELSFVSFCIALETVIPGNEQLTYRFKRNLAILCGEDVETSEKIFENCKKLYEFRSQIVHAAVREFNRKKTIDYYNYAKAIASRMIIEMVLHNHPTNDELDKKLTVLGFGDRNKISKDYKPIVANKKNYSKFVLTKLA